MEDPIQSPYQQGAPSGPDLPGVEKGKKKMSVKTIIIGIIIILIFAALIYFF